MSTDYMSSTTVSDHDLTLAIPGEVGSVRVRLVEALQRLSYKVLEEQPLHAKRGAQCSARWDCSLNVLDYPTNLRISLKQTNDLSVLATFNYEVKSYMRMTRGDRQTLAREAEAIAAIATERHAISACRTCGTQITDESHFCRRCGAPLTVDVPELEVLRLTKETRGSYHHIVVGMVVMFLAVLAVSLLFLFTGVRITGPLLWIAIPLSAYALFLLFQGTWQLHHALNPKTKTKSVTTSALPAFKSSATTALPPTPVHASVTEGTTGLLVPARDRREQETIPRKAHDTGEMDTDRLM